LVLSPKTAKKTSKINTRETQTVERRARGGSDVHSLNVGAMGAVLQFTCRAAFVPPLLTKTPARNARGLYALHHRRHFAANHHNEGFMFHNQTIFAAALSDQFRTSANWRNGQAKRFAHDKRNADAAKR
jgi:hypothetical protein